MANLLTDEQRAELDEAFGLFDAKKKGRLGVVELGGFMRHWGQNLANADLVQLAGAQGADKAAVLDWFGTRTGAGASDSSTDVLKAFEVFDRDGNGLISTVELRHVLTGLGERLDPASVEEMLRNSDQGDGMVNYSAFVQTIMANQQRY